MLRFVEVPTKDPSEPPLQVGKKDPLDWSEQLSIDLIRQHTKTDDVAGVSDEMLGLYRWAAVEAAEMYTGALLTFQKTVTEPIQGPNRPKPGKLTYRHKLQYPVADGLVHLYGSQNVAGNHAIRVPPNTRTIKVPIWTGFIDLSNCCDPCSSHHLNADMMAAYKAGYRCPADVPVGIVLGMLQYVAWILEHPGDILLTVRNKEDNSTKGLMGSNNIALASGALETWRQYDPEAF
jgi:hypothetical protein